MDRVTDNEIKKFKKNGVDIHDHKPNSKFDLFKDRKTGNVYVLPKNGKGTPDPTNLTTDGYRDMSLDN